ncbi:MAG: hypothetical protein ACJ8AT_21605 [Hyalangium sp.]|uniref:hypothetical protein n=1 Tax=Hyalangium sp. TaxID=2028555 RepID=UPI00389B2374
MTSGRFWLIAAALASPALAAIACGGGGAPCTTCAPIEGRYPLEFAAGAVPADCASLNVALPRGPLDIQRAGSQLTATLDNVPLQGTLFQSSDFNLLGSQAAQDGGSTTQFAFSGSYTPGRADGGTGSLSGSFTGTYSRPSPQGTGRCTLPRAYTATQQPAQP